MTHSVSPWFTVWPGSTLILTTVPLAVELIAISIFMASSVQSACPTSTWSPSPTLTSSVASSAL